MCRPVGIVIKNVAKTVAVGVNLVHERLSEGMCEYAQRVAEPFADADGDEAVIEYGLDCCGRDRVRELGQNPRDRIAFGPFALPGKPSVECGLCASTGITAPPCCMALRKRHSEIMRWNGSRITVMN